MRRVSSSALLRLKNMPGNYDGASICYEAVHEEPHQTNGFVETTVDSNQAVCLIVFGKVSP